MTRQVTLFGIVMTLCFLLVGGTVAALARGFASSDPELRAGMAVTQSKDSDSVIRASQENKDSVLGIVTTFDSNLVTVGSKEHRIFVQLDGEVEAYVTDFGGDIKKGDRLTVSPLAGVLMADNQTATAIIAVAEENLANGKDKEIKKIQTNKGEQDVIVGKIKVSLDYKTQVSSQNQGVSESLKQLGRSVANKEVSAVRVVLAMIVFLVILIVEGGIIYGAVSSALTAIGRNPLARKFIRQEAIRIVGVAILVFLLGIAAVYLIVWL